MFNEGGGQYDHARTGEARKRFRFRGKQGISRGE